MHVTDIDEADGHFGVMSINTGRAGRAQAVGT
jgi:hypothetical protein